MARSAVEERQQQQQEEEDNRHANTFKILIATDNHIGYLEDDPIRGQDSFKTFEEILKLAQLHQVDFILLGGDLFHHNRPSRHCLHETMRLLRHYCMGDKPSQVWIASDQSQHFQDDFCTANYLDPNLNVSYPVFSIHGNHDDPNGPGNLCALQLLSVAGLINYFGRTHSVQDMVVQPILMRKGTSKLALYGLGNVRDERLHRMWRDGHVQFSRPAEEEWLDDSTFNLFVLHQNRVKHGPTSYIPEPFLESFLDLVLWGHEHDCRIDPEHSTHHEGPYITQPGSSVATSLSQGEALSKHVGLLYISGNDYTLEKLRLTTVRPFQFTGVNLQETSVPVNDAKTCQRYLQKVVDDLIVRAKEEWKVQEHERTRSILSQLGDRRNSVSNSNHNDEDDDERDTTDRPMPLPLIRVRVDYTGGYEVFNPQQFGQQYTNRVANPKDMLKFQRIKTPTAGGSSSARQKSRSASALLEDMSVSVPERLDQIKVEDLVNEILCRDLTLFPENELENAVKMFVDKDDKDAIRRFVNASVSRLYESIPDSADVDVITEEYIRRKAQANKAMRMEAFARDYAGLPSTQPTETNPGQLGQANRGNTDINENDVIQASSRPQDKHQQQQQGQQERQGQNQQKRTTQGRRTLDSNDDQNDFEDDDMGGARATGSKTSRHTTAKRTQRTAPVQHEEEEQEEGSDGMEMVAPTRTARGRTNKRPAPPPLSSSSTAKPQKSSRTTSRSSASITVDSEEDNIYEEETVARSQTLHDTNSSRRNLPTATKAKGKASSSSLSSKQPTKTTLNRTPRAKQDYDHDDADDDGDEPLFESYDLPTQSQSRRHLPSSLSTRKN